jgi:hypothetical protein
LREGRRESIMHSLSDLRGNDAGISGKRGKKNYRGVGSENRWGEVTANGQVGPVSGDRWVQLSSAVTDSREEHLVPEGPLLAPFYDLLSMRIYTHYGLAERLAMKIGGESDPRDRRPGHQRWFRCHQVQ